MRIINIIASNIRKRIKVRRIMRVAVAVAFLLSIVFTSLFWPVQKAKAATIAYRASGATSTANNAATISLAMPTGTIEGDLMVAFIGISSAAIPALAGWTSGATCVNGSATKISILYKRAASGEAGPYAFTWTGATYGAGGIVTYSGADAVTTDAVGTCGFNTSNTAINPDNITTVAANALVVVGYSQMTNTGTSNTISTAFTGANDRMKTQSNLTVGCGVLCTANTNAASFDGTDFTQATPGLVTGSNKNATSTQSAAYAAVMVSFKPALTTYTMAEYQWFTSVDAKADLISTVNDVTAGDDKISGSALDVTNGYIYTVGGDSGGGGEWRIEKRKTSNAELVYAFNSGGVITSNPSANDDRAVAVALDVNGGYLYVAGYDSVTSTTDIKMRIEKYNATTGLICSSAANCAAGAFNTSGVVIENPTSTSDKWFALALDVTGGYLHAAGVQSIGGGTSGGWYMAKYNAATGNLCSSGANCAAGAFNTTGLISETFAGKGEQVYAVALDTTNGFVYYGGFDGSPSGPSTQWRVEKKNAATGVAATGFAAGCAGAPAGVYCSNAQSTDQLRAMIVDTTNNFIYAAGHDSGGGNEWRVEKLSTADASKVAAFGGAGCATNLAGVMCDNATAGDDKIRAIALDTTNGFLYLSGYDSTGANELRIDKLNSTTGAFITAFNTTGKLAENATAGDDEFQTMAVDVAGGYIYAGGYDSTGSNQWLMEKRSATSGTGAGYTQSAPVGVHTVYNAGVNASLHLRMLVRVAGYNMYANIDTFKLQISSKSGTCDTAYSGESFVDLTPNTSNVRYLDNTSIPNTTTAALTGDPIDGVNPIVRQPNVEANNYTGSSTTVTGSDGLWDFTIKDSDATNLAFGSYCFRIVSADNTSTIATPLQVPELVYCNRLSDPSKRLHQANYFCNETRTNAFYWSIP